MERLEYPWREDGRPPSRRNSVTAGRIDQEFAFHSIERDASLAAYERVRDLLRLAAHELNDLLPECTLKGEAIDHLRSAMWAGNGAIACYGKGSAVWVEAAADRVALDVERAGGDPSEPHVPALIVEGPLTKALADTRIKIQQGIREGGLDPAGFERRLTSLGQSVADEARARQAGKP